MTWAELVWRNLLRRRVRTLLTAAGVAIGVGLIVALLSLTAGATKTADELIHVGRADFGLFQRGVSDLTLSRLSNNLAARIDREPGVARTARIYLYVTKSLLVFGLDRNEFAARRLVVVDGSRSSGDEALVGDAGARRLHLRPGGLLRIGRRAFRVAGLYHTGNSFEDGGAVLPLRLVQRLAGRPGDVTTIGVQVALRARPHDVAHRIEHDFPGTLAVSEPGQAVNIDTSSRLIVSTGWILSLLALIVGGIAVTNTMAMSVFERVREIGILRAVGWRTRRVAGLIVSEALGICLAGLALGVGLGIAAAELFTTGGNGTLLQPDFTPGVFAWGLAFALGVAVLGAIYPAWRAARLTPIEALRRE
ncbi:MAG: FtsX-like permease family protein [Gaiellaceae bacterium]